MVSPLHAYGLLIARRFHRTGKTCGGRSALRLPSTPSSEMERFYSEEHNAEDRLADLIERLVCPDSPPARQ